MFAVIIRSVEACTLLVVCLFVCVSFFFERKRERERKNDEIRLDYSTVCIAITEWFSRNISRSNWRLFLPSLSLFLSFSHSLFVYLSAHLFFLPHVFSDTINPISEWPKWKIMKVVTRTCCVYNGIWRKNKPRSMTSKEEKKAKGTMFVE